MVLMPGFQSTRLATEGALEPFFFLYTDDSIHGNPETCKRSSIMLNYEVKNSLFHENSCDTTYICTALEKVMAPHHPMGWFEFFVSFKIFIIS